MTDDNNVFRYTQRCKSVENIINCFSSNALLDPSTSDLTARVLDLMGKSGYDLNFDPAKKAIKFLKKEQKKNASWRGRWGTNYVYGTWSVVVNKYQLLIANDYEFY